MRETRQSGSEGGVGRKPHPYPYCSRWLSEAWRATPPVLIVLIPLPGGMPDESVPARLASLRDAVFVYHGFRWCRALARPQPQAKFWQASGLLARPGTPTSFQIPRSTTTHHPPPSCSNAGRQIKFSPGKTIPPLTSKRFAELDEQKNTRFHFSNLYPVNRGSMDT